MTRRLFLLSTLLLPFLRLKPKEEFEKFEGFYGWQSIACFKRPK